MSPRLPMVFDTHRACLRTRTSCPLPHRPRLTGVLPVRSRLPSLLPHGARRAIMPATMSESFQPGRRVTVAEAAVILGVSLSRVRQLIHDGLLKAEKIRRNSGTAYMIDLDAAPKSVL